MPPIACLIPAHPGTYVLLGTLDADQFIVAKINVVAWAAAGDALVPVTVAGANHGQECRLAVLQPDGSVEEAEGGVFANQDEWRRVAVKRVRAAEIAKAA
jgi:hypothetical protein